MDYAVGIYEDIVETLADFVEKEALPEALIDILLSDNIEINTFELSEKEFINISADKTTSIKPINIILKPKNLFADGLELLASLQKPSSKFQVAQMFLLLILKIVKSSVCDLPVDADKVLIFLHERNAYRIGIDESELIALFDNIAYGKIIKFMLKYKIAEIVDGKVMLLEKVHITKQYTENN